MEFTINSNIFTRIREILRKRHTHYIIKHIHFDMYNIRVTVIISPQSSITSEITDIITYNEL